MKLGGDFSKPFSVAFVAADILMRETIVPRLPEHMVPLAEEAFHGARFECIMRGRFPHAAAYDIKSAYPAHLRLVAHADGTWIHGRRPHKDALHAIVRVIASVPPEDYPVMAPFPVKRRGVTVYPTGVFDTTVLLDTYRRHENLLTPLESWSYVPSGEVSFPYRATVDRLLAFREESDELLNASAKRGNNSLYGKLLNQRMEKRLVADAIGDHFSGKRVMIDGEPYRVERVKRRGLLYNPLHAGLVTEACRLQIWDACARSLDDVLMIQADGIVAKRAFLGRDKARVAGDLGFVAEGDTIVCGSGLYEIKGYARRTRGVMFSRNATNERKGGKARRLPGKGWFSLLRGVRGEKVLFRDVRPAHLSEALNGSSYRPLPDEIRTLGLKDANVFLPFHRDLNVCRDEKREWPDIGDARRLLAGTFRSLPVEWED